MVAASSPKVDPLRCCSYGKGHYGEGNIMAEKSSVAIGTWPTPERLVRVSIPAKVAYDLGNFQKVQVAILERLGCKACCSGWDIRWDITRSFAVDGKLNIREMVSGGVIVDG